MGALYTTTVTVEGGRSGRATSVDGNFNQVLTIPKELGGDGAAGTNPEQLFAAGYAACFESALRLIARQQKISVDGTTVTASVSLHKDGDGYKLSAGLKVNIPGVEKGEAEKLAEAAHQFCPYSKATRGNIEVTLSAE
ncbi:organic hydroperoxide resistance protein [Paenibacillus pinihumi]|uniref:organic hydroperoxide resistance protein n=1 Tax=Paenibacillus pinihumi TaxID=669462 RepID=UPI0003F8291E|nr:organic hydroperoxide resistance protein [Paenibacillus pinihumi]